jgi:hypothetical protein
MSTEGSVQNQAMQALVFALSRRPTPITEQELKSWFERASEGVRLDGQIDEVDLAEAIASAQKTGFRGTEINRKNLARWFEVPSDEFGSVRPEQLEPEVLIRHMHLENQFRQWLEEWNYEVVVGEDLEGEGDVTFTADVYGKLDTLHGKFEVCVNFICDEPPSTDRVKSLLESLEAYATSKSEFREGDLYIVATPAQRFTNQASNALTRQADEEKYTVLKLEGDDLWSLQSARDPRARFELLMEHVERSILTKHGRSHL